MMRTILFALTALLPLTGHADIQLGVVDRNEAITAVNSKVEYVGLNNESLPPESYPKEVYLLFPVIPGAIFGDPTTRPIYKSETSIGRPFSINLLDRKDQIDNISQPLKERWLKLGLSIEPNKTKISRIGTFAYDSRTDKELGIGEGFLDPRSRDFLVLMYVDQLCHITGKIKEGSQTFVHDIKFDSPGFHWVSAHKTSDKSYLYMNYRSNGPIIFAIQMGPGL